MSTAPYQLLDDGFAPPACDLLVIGCGNILRGDDAVGPVLVRELMARGCPDGVRVVDGGTAGMDVAFGMRGASRVVIVDAATTGSAAGTLYRVPAAELAELPPLTGLHTHNFRWDHALSFADWLLGPEKPSDITVFLIEAASFEPGAPLTQDVAAGMESVLAIVEKEFFPKTSSTVEITEQGYLHLPAALAAAHFPADATLMKYEEHRLELMPLHAASHGGWVLKQRNAAGDRSLLVIEALGFVPLAGEFPARWDEQRGALIVEVADGGTGGHHDGDPRVGSLGGVGDRDRAPGSRPSSALGLADTAGGATASGRGASDRDSSSPAEGGSA